MPSLATDSLLLRKWIHTGSDGGVTCPSETGPSKMLEWDEEVDLHEPVEQMQALVV